MLIENIVGHIDLDFKIPLKKIMKEAVASDVPGVIYKVNEPQAAALIFSSGKIVCTGTSSVGKAQDAINVILEKLRVRGVDAPATLEIKIDNITAAARIQADLDLEELGHSLHHCKYNSSLSALVCHIEDTGATILLYSSGRILCTNTKTIESVHKSLEILKKDLESVGVRVKQLLM